MIDGMLDWLVQGLGLGAQGEVLDQMLRPLGAGTTPPRVVVVDAPLHRPLREAGYQVYDPGQPGSELPDALCATLHGRDLLPALREWAGQVRDGGIVLLLSRRGQPQRAAVCAAFLHAGLVQPVQRARGVAVLTAGQVVR